MPMDQFLAEFYGTKTAAAAPQEDLEKEASVDLFLKLASEEGIDLAKLPDAQVQELYTRWKTAAEEPEKKEEKKEHEEEKREHVVEKAKEEHEEKKAYAEKVAEADFLGRVMAHAYVQEMRKIASEVETPAAEEPKVDDEKAKEAAMPEALRKGLEAAKGHAGKASKAVGEHFERTGHAIAGKTLAKHTTAPKANERLVGAAAHAAGATALGATAHHALKGKEKKEKKGSALDELGAEQAVLIAHQGGLDAEEAGAKVAAVLTLGLVGESVKVASAPDVETAAYIRGLELLEAAGYPVQWTE